MKSKAPWAVLGVAKLIGEPPTKESIGRRAGLLRDLLSVVGTSSSQASSEDKAKEVLLSGAAEAESRCNSELPGVLLERKRQKVGAQSVPQWQEPSPQLYKFLESKGTVTLCLSNLQALQGGDRTGPAGINDNRLIHKSLSAGDDHLLATLARYPGQTLVVWAPQDRANVTRMLHSYRALRTKHSISTNLLVVTSHDQYPGCDTPELLLDLWHSPMLEDKCCLLYTS